MLINTKLYIKLNWTKDCLTSAGADDATNFQITKTELYVTVFTLKTADNNKLNELFETEFERSVFWNEYKSKIQTVAQNGNNFKRIMLDGLFQGVNRLFVMGFNDIDGDVNRVRREDYKKILFTKNKH